MMVERRVDDDGKIGDEEIKMTKGNIMFEIRLESKYHKRSFCFDDVRT